MPLEFYALPLQVRDRCRVLYETENISFATLAKRFGTNHGTLHSLAEREGWMRFNQGVRNIAEEVEAAIMTQELPHPAPDKVPPHRPAPSTTDKRDKGRPTRGRPRRAAESHTAKAIAAARKLYQPGKTNMMELARVLHVDTKALYYARKQEKWDEAPPPPQPSVAAVQVLGPGEDPQKTQLRITLAAIRAAMSVEQIRQLERFDTLLGKYWYWLEVYLAPHQYVDTANMTKRKADAALAKAQRTALRMIAPTEKDSFTAGLRTLSDALFRSIELKRSVAGLNKVIVGNVPSGLQPGDPGDENADGPQLIDVDGLSTEDLRAVRRGMELLERHQRDHRAIPLPPVPDPIDDLLGPEAEVIEPTIPR
jgi:hypothetical protein